MNNQTPTVTVQAEPQSSPPRCDLELADYDLYVRAVLAESVRLFHARVGKMSRLWFVWVEARVDACSKYQATRITVPADSSGSAYEEATRDLEEQGFGVRFPIKAEPVRP